MNHAPGFSLVEMLLALVITLIVSAGVFAVVRAAHEAAVTGPEMNDLQQRLRIGSDGMLADLIQAGASSVATKGRLLSRIIPVVMPFRTGPLRPDPPGTFKTDTITVIYAPAGGRQATIAQPLMPGMSIVSVNASPGCPANLSGRDPACGFTPELPVLVFDDSGASDSFTVVDVIGSRLALRHSGGGTAHSYPAGSSIAEVKTVTYYRKTASAQLMRYNGIESDAAVADNVVDLEFHYFASGASGLVALSPAELLDGPWRPDAADPNRYDADLLRIRRVAVRLRLRPAARVRNVEAREVYFDVAPRNLGGAP